MIYCNRPAGWALAALLGWLLPSVALAEVPEGTTLMGADAQVFVSVPDAAELVEAFDQTQFGKLLDDPIMRPFRDDLKQQLEDNLSETGQRLGLQWEDFEGLSGGEVSFAITLAPRPEGAPEEAADEAFITVAIDVTGHEEQAGDVVEKAALNLVQKRNAVRRVEAFGDVELIVFDVPASQTRPAGTAVYFLKDSVLGIADNLAAIKAVIERWRGERQDSIGTVEAYNHVMQHCSADAADEPVHGRWFVRPLGAIRAVRALDPPEEIESPDLLVVAENQGFGAIEALGGIFGLGIGDYGLVHRTLAYVPGELTKGSGMLVFPTGNKFAPLPWVPREVASYTAAYWDMKAAFEAFGYIFDEVIGEGEEGIFNDVIQSVIDDPNGPQIDIRNDLAGHLGTRIVLMTDHQLPITEESNRWLLAAEVTDIEAMKIAVAKSMKNDPTVTEHMVGEHIVYEIIGEETLFVEEAAPVEDAFAEEELVALPNSAITVAQGHLIIGSHLDIVEKILADRAEAEALAGDADYRLVMSELDKLHSGNAIARRFARVDAEIRVSYELFRANKLAEAETPVGRLIGLLKSVAGGGAGEEETKIDGSKLPEFEAIRRFLGPAGAVITDVEQGWFMVGFTLNKEPALSTATRGAGQPGESE